MSHLKILAAILSLWWLIHFLWWLIHRQNKVIEKQKASISVLAELIKDHRKKLAGAGVCRFNAMPQCDDLLHGKCWLTWPNCEGWIFDSPSECTNWSHWLPYWFIPLVTAPTEPFRHDSKPAKPWEGQP